MKIGMTGNRTGITEEAKKELLSFLDNNTIEEVHHGDCIGADEEFHNICASLHLKIVIHPPNNTSFRAFCKGDVILEEKPYLKRNHDIVDQTDMLLAFPSTIKPVLRSGTWSTIRYAQKKNKKVYIIYPN